MPELPEVETVRRQLHPWLVGRRITRARRVEAPPGPKYLNLERAAGQRILDVTRRGKFLILPLDGGDELIVHLGMTGAISPTKDGDHLRVELHLDGPAPRRLYFDDVRRFGRFLVVPSGRYEVLPTLRGMGPEPLGEGFTLEAFAAAMGRSRMPTKAWIMSQRPVAGVGNIYADEALWRARINPKTLANRVSRRRLGELRGAIVDILSAAIEAKGTTFSSFRDVEGHAGAFVGQLCVYGRGGEPCLRCGQQLKSEVVGQRTTTYCARCQRLVG
ncbi:MAG: bifunctional DNA-formamidopyrimidine glycosylase/DNA-(apurinic or apyrimidinic site) lyase [Polyangiaceae bacterium]